MNKRIAWLDTAKFLGIFLIYLFHIGEHSGYMYTYSTQVCNHLFFLLAGYAEHFGKTDSWKDCIARNAKRLLLPYLLFAGLSTALSAIYHNTYTVIPDNVVLILKGVPRGQFCAHGLWFLSCLFVVRLVFFALRKGLKRPAPMLIASLVLLILTNTPLRQAISALKLFNINFMFSFLFFYVLGYCTFDRTRSLLELNTPRKKALFLVIAVLSAGYTVIVFFGKNPLRDLCSFSQVTRLAAELVHPLILSAFILVLAKLIEDVAYLQALGRETLYLCGSEYMIGLTLMTTLRFFDVTPNFSSAFTAYIYAMVLMTIGHHVFVPFEKAILNKLSG